MIPSRGLQKSARTLNGSVSRLTLVFGSSRQFSSGPASTFNGRIGVPRDFSISAARAPWSSLRSQTQFSLRSAQSVRHNTTSAVPPSPFNEDPFVTTSLDAASDLTSGGLSSITPHIGYLKELGLDFGWGPTAVTQWALEHIHVFCGTPWWASILLVTAGLRLFMIKPTISAAATGARLAEISPITQPIKDRMLASGRLGNQTESMVARQELMQIHKRANIKTWKAFLPMLQIPFGYGIFRLTRSMASLPVPGLEDGGLAWFTNLTLHDPFFILPMATAGAVYIGLKKGVETGQMLSPAAHKMLTIVFPVMAGGFMVYWPAALQLSFFFSSVFGMFQSILLRNPTFRVIVGLPPKTPNSSSSLGGNPTGPSSPTSPSSARMTISPSYKPPTVKSSITSSQVDEVKPEQPEKKKGFINETISEVKGMSDGLMKSARQYMGTEPSAPGQRSVAEKKQNKAFEQRRQRELESEKQDLEDDSLARWHQRKLEQQERRLRQSERERNR